MKICFLGYDNLPVLAREYNHHGVGGAQVQMSLVAKALVKCGYEVSMVVGDYGQKDGDAWHGIKTFKTFRAKEGFPVVRFIHPRWTRTWDSLARTKADVYFTSCAGMQVGLLALFCKLHSKGFIFRMAHNDDADPHRMLVRLWRDKKLYEYGLKRADVILCQNTTQRDRLKKNYNLDCTLIKSLVESPDKEYPLQDREIEVLWVSNLRDIKRPDLALELARRLYPHRVHMAGGRQPGFEKMYVDIEQEAKSIENMTFHGRVPYHEIGDLFDRSRVFVNTSDSEGFPNTYLQSWRRGVPVVAFFDPDDLIRREGLGYAVGSMEEMQQAVERLLSDDEEWHRISARCRDYMERHHGDDVVLKPYLDAIELAYRSRRPT